VLATRKFSDADQLPDIVSDMLWSAGSEYNYSIGMLIDGHCPSSEYGLQII